jgi:hypothetical protein
VLNRAIQMIGNIDDVEDLVYPSRSGIMCVSKTEEVSKRGTYVVVRQVIFSLLESMISSSVLLHVIINTTAC